jgi:hypothetical protein
MSRVIFYGAAPVAIAAPECVYFLPPLDELGPEHRLGRFVGWMALYCHRVGRGELSGPYEAEGAERYAREALIEEGVDGHRGWRWRRRSGW